MAITPPCPARLRTWREKRVASLCRTWVSDCLQMTVALVPQHGEAMLEMHACSRTSGVRCTHQLSLCAATPSQSQSTPAKLPRAQHRNNRWAPCADTATPTLGIWATPTHMAQLRLVARVLAIACLGPQLRRAKLKPNRSPTR